MYEGDTEWVRAFLKRNPGANLRRRDPLVAMSPLENAVKGGHVDCARLLLDAEEIDAEVRSALENVAAKRLAARLLLACCHRSRGDKLPVALVLEIAGRF